MHRHIHKTCIQVNITPTYIRHTYTHGCIHADRQTDRQTVRPRVKRPIYLIIEACAKV